MKYVSQFVLCLILINSAFAVSNPAVSVNPLEAGATASYEFTFDTSRQMNPGDIIVVQTNNSSGANFSNSNFVSMSPVSGSISNRNQTSSSVTLSGVINNGAAVTLVVDNIVNPGNSGLGPSYTIRTVVFVNGAPSILEASAAGTVYEASSSPAVTTPISDQVIYEYDGNQTIVSDLNQHFADGDMDNLTFSIDNGHDSNLVAPSVQGDTLSLQGLDSGSTQVTVRASDLPSGNGEGEVTDSFNVRVIGELDNVMLQLSDNQGGANSAYTLSFDAVADINTNHFIIFQTPNGGSDFANATLGSLTGGTLTVDILSQSAEDMVFEVTSGFASDGTTLQLVINNVLNPSIANQGPDYDVRIFDSAISGDQDAAIIPGVFFSSIVGTPTVTQSIASANIHEVDGSVIWVSDLNNHFNDSDGDPLTFTVEPGYDMDVLGANINGAVLSLLPLKNGTTTVSIKASDLPSGSGEGEAMTSFNVTVLGELEMLIVSPSDDEVNTMTDYEISFIADDGFDQGDMILFQSFDTRPDFSSVGTGDITVSSNNIELSITAAASGGVSISTANSLINPGDIITFTIENATNPSSAGIGDDYLVTHFRSGSIATGSAIGTEYNNSDVIFSDGFDDSITRKLQSKSSPIQLWKLQKEYMKIEQQTSDIEPKENPHSIQ